MLAELELIKKLLRSAKQLQHYRTQSSQQPDARYLSELERLLHSLEDRIAAMKLSNRQSLLELTQKERRLESELNDFEQRIADWERRSNNIIDQQQQSKHHQSGPEVDRLSERMKSLSTDRRVEEYDLYLSRRGGRTGGWTDEDHTAFTKLRAKYRVRISIKQVYHNNSSILWVAGERRRRFHQYLHHPIGNEQSGY
jgi:uncharacterized protein YeeX (DUF496 family)